MKTREHFHDSYALEFLRKLLTTDSPSGYETEAQNLIVDYVGDRFGANLNYNHIYFESGTFVAQQGTGPKKILISAHYDEIGFQVSYINDSGLLCLSKLGGVDLKVMMGQYVTIHSSITGETITGIIGKEPIHVENPDKRYSISENIYEYLVDIGAENKEEAQKLVSIGDYGVIFSVPILDFGENRLVARGLDDKIGVYIMTQVARKLSHFDQGDKYSILYAAFPQEETGLRGAQQSIPHLNPDISIDIDVMFATDEGRGISKEKYGEISLGKGVLINHGPDKSVEINNLLKSVAKEFDIAIQEIVTGRGGTNTDVIWTGAKNCKTTHLGIPLRNMHTPVEVVDWRDIDAAIGILVETIKKIVAND